MCVWKVSPSTPLFPIERPSDQVDPFQEHPGLLIGPSGLPPLSSQYPQPKECCFILSFSFSLSTRYTPFYLPTSISISYIVRRESQQLLRERARDQAGKPNVRREAN